jgi:indole-3-glycerol phosphate synthase
MSSPSVPTILDTILADVQNEVAIAKRRRSGADLRGMIGDAPPVRSFAKALMNNFGLIAEIKQRSPSVGPMRSSNVLEAPDAYEESPVVRALSILTNERHFGGSIEYLSKIRERVSKPILRKDFIIEEYQIREARAFGADAILLMASVLDASRLKGFHELVLELGMEALFEVHDEAEIEALPKSARIVGINSRKFKTSEGFKGFGTKGYSEKDFSTNLDAFQLVDRLPEGTLRVAESGLDARNVTTVRGLFHAALVGTSLLRDSRGISAGLADFEEALFLG